MSYRPPATLGVLRLLAQNALLRLFRAFHVQRAKRQKAAGMRRQATPRKSGSGLFWLMLLMVPMFLFQAAMMSRRVGHNLMVAAHRTAPGDERICLGRDLHRALAFVRDLDHSALAAELDRRGIGEDHRPSRARILRQFDTYGRAGFAAPRRIGDATFAELEPGVTSPAARRLFRQSAGVLLLLLVGVALCAAFGGASASLAGGDWQQAWLFTFPVPTRSLVVARAFEYALVQLFPWFTVLPFVWTVLAKLDQPWAGGLAAVATLSVAFLVGGLRLWGETVLRLRCSLRTLKNVQGFCSLASIGLMGFLFWVGLSRSTPFAFVDVVGSLPDWFGLMPGAWPVGLDRYGWLAALLGLSASVAVFAAAIAGTSRALAGGVMQSGGVDASKRGNTGAWRRTRRLDVVGKEATLLRRDRNFLVQTVVVPLFVTLLQWIVNPVFGDAEGVGVAMVAYFVGFYGATGGCFQVLSGEGRALWMLYALPVGLGRVLAAKTRVWALLACGFAAAALLVFTLRRPGFGWLPFAGDLGFVLAGVFCAAHIAASLSVLGANPTQDAVQRQLRQRYAYLFLFLAGCYMLVLASDGSARRLAGATVFATLTFALWQRAVDRLRWLLDPVTDTRARLTMLDAGAALLAFFLVQAIALLALQRRGGIDFRTVTIAFVVGAALSLLLSFWRLHKRGVPLRRELGLDRPIRVLGRPMALAGLAGVGVGLLALAYVELLRDAVPDVAVRVAAADRPALLLLAVLAAPLAEEALFRGLLIGGMLRSVRPVLALLWSSALFAFLHPVAAWPPVFLVGVGCAMVRLRSGSLWPAVTLHAAYNAVVVGLQ